MASRTESRALAAIAELKTEVPDAQVEFLQFDLTSLASASAAAARFLALEQRLDILVNNAGVVRLPVVLFLAVR